MTAVNSTMLELGTKAPPFRLPSATGGTVSVEDFSDASALLVMFICNHCPFVKHVRDELVKLANDYRPRGVAVVAVNSNDWSTYPDDSPEMMEKEVEGVRLSFCLSLRRNPGGGQGLPGCLHPGLLSLRCPAGTRLQRPVGRQPSRKRGAGERPGPPGSARRPAGGRARPGGAEAEPRL